MEELAQEIAVETGQPIEEVRATLLEEKGERELVLTEALSASAAPQQLNDSELFPPIVIAPLEEDGEEDSAMQLLRRRYAESQEQQQLSGAGDEPAPEPEPAGMDPVVERGLEIGDEPDEEDWLFLERRAEARSKLSDDERAELDLSLCEFLPCLGPSAITATVSCTTLPLPQMPQRGTGTFEKSREFWAEAPCTMATAVPTRPLLSTRRRRKGMPRWWLHSLRWAARKPRLRRTNSARVPWT